MNEWIKCSDKLLGLEMSHRYVFSKGTNEIVTDWMRVPMISPHLFFDKISSHYITKHERTCLDERE